MTHNILSSAYRVHSKLGPGLLERSYRVCLCHELHRLNLTVETEKLLPVEYDGLTIDTEPSEDITARRTDHRQKAQRSQSPRAELQFARPLLFAPASAC